MGIMIYLIQSPGFYVKTSRDIPKSFDDKMTMLMATICEKSGFTLHELKSASKKRELVLWRQIAFYIASIHYYGPLYEIGLYFGGRHWATVIHGRQAVKEAIDVNDYMVISRIKQLSRFVKVQHSSAKEYIYTNQD